MKNESISFIVYDAIGKILRTGICPKSVLQVQATGPTEFAIEGEANDAVDKIEIEELDEKGKPVKIKIKKKTPEEIEAERPPEIPEEDMSVMLSKKEYQSILDRLEALENPV